MRVQLLEARRQHRAAIAFALLDPVEDRRRRRGDAAALQAIAELVQRADAAVEPALDLVDRAAVARGVELVEDLLLDAGGIGARAIRDPAQQVGGRRATARVDRVEHGHREDQVFRTLKDNIIPSHN